MFIRPCYRRKDGKRHAYWALMESYRTERGPRQRVVAYLGQLDEPHRLGVKEAAEGKQGRRQKRLFDDVRPQWVEVDVKRLRVENLKDAHGLGRQHRLLKAERTALHCGYAQEHAQTIRAGTALGRLAHDPRRAGGQALSFARRRREGCYLLRSNVVEWSDEELWKAYIQLTEAEAAFRIHKSDLRLRPIWHQKEERVLVHILVCFLAYVLWKTLSQRCQRAGLGHEPRRVFEELGKIQLVDVVLPTRQGTEIRRRCVTQPTDHQTILLTRLQFRLPAIRLTEGV